MFATERVGSRVVPEKKTTAKIDLSYLPESEGFFLFLFLFFFLESVKKGHLPMRQLYTFPFFFFCVCAG